MNEARNKDEPSMRNEVTCNTTQSHRRTAENSQSGNFRLWGDTVRLYVSIRKSNRKFC